MNAPVQDPNKVAQPTLKSVPRDKGAPIVGHTFSILRDPLKWGEGMVEKYGMVFRYNAFFQDFYFLGGKEALELVWLDKDKAFSAQAGYQAFLSGITEKSLLLMDFHEHRSHRQALNPAFKADVMKLYLEQMQNAISERVSTWRTEPNLTFYPAIKQLTLDVATRAFIGIEDPKARDEINEALTHIMASFISPLRWPIPGTLYWKGLKAQKFLEKYLLSEIPKRRNNDGTDIFSRLCNEKTAEGVPFSDDEIIGHLITFWVAGHDTLASSLTTLIYHLAKHPDWQEKLRSEILEANLDLNALDLTSLGKLNLCDNAFKEALRLQPPILSTPRRAIKDVEFQGFHIPAGSMISESIMGAHYDEDIWPEPEKFDPMRFAPENTPKDRPKYAWAPFGGGAHKCIGMIFAQIQAKVFLANILTTNQINVAEGYEWDIQLLPTPRPKDGLPISLTPTS